MKKSVRHIKTALTAFVILSMLLVPVISASPYSSDNNIVSCTCCCRTMTGSDNNGCRSDLSDAQKTINQAPCCCLMEQDTNSTIPAPIDSNTHEEKENSQKISNVEVSYSTVIAPTEKRIDNNITYDGSHNPPLFIINSSFLI